MSSSKKNIVCAHCSAENPSNYTFCHCCRQVPGSKPAPGASAPKRRAASSSKKAAAKKRPTKKG